MPRERPPTVPGRRAVVYVRQLSGAQVHENLASQRRPYALRDVARGYGFQDVQVIDADLGRAASGTMDRPGFQSLVGQICEGLVGAVFCLEASRLARNGRDGTTSSSCTASWAPTSSTQTASAPPAIRTIGCCSGSRAR
jgi:hypothetical protein